MGAILDALDRVETAIKNISSEMNDVLTSIEESIKSIENTTEDALKKAFSKGDLTDVFQLSLQPIKSVFDKYGLYYDDPNPGALGKISSIIGNISGQTMAGIRISGTWSAGEIRLITNMKELRHYLVNMISMDKIKNSVSNEYMKGINKLIEDIDSSINEMDNLYDSGKSTYINNEEDRIKWVKNIITDRYRVIPPAVALYSYGKNVLHNLISIVDYGNASNEYTDWFKKLFSQESFYSQDSLYLTAQRPVSNPGGYRIEIVNGAETEAVTTQNDPKKFLDALAAAYKQGTLNAYSR